MTSVTVAAVSAGLGNGLRESTIDTQNAPSQSKADSVVASLLSRSQDPNLSPVN